MLYVNLVIFIGMVYCGVYFKVDFCVKSWGSWCKEFIVNFMCFIENYCVLMGIEFVWIRFVDI